MVRGDNFLLGLWFGLEEFLFPFMLGFSLTLWRFNMITFNKSFMVRAYGSIFMTGNMKSMSANLAQYIITKDKQKLRSVGIYAALISIFFAGAAIATLAGNWFGSWTMMGSTFMIGAVYLIIRFDEI